MHTCDDWLFWLYTGNSRTPIRSIHDGAWVRQWESGCTDTAYGQLVKSMLGVGCCVVLFVGCGGWIQWLWACAMLSVGHDVNTWYYNWLCQHHHTERQAALASKTRCDRPGCKSLDSKSLKCGKCLSVRYCSTECRAQRAMQTDRTC